jgi:hypothetical protein
MMYEKIRTIGKKIYPYIVCVGVGMLIVFCFCTGTKDDYSISRTISDIKADNTGARQDIKYAREQLKQATESTARAEQAIATAKQTTGRIKSGNDQDQADIAECERIISTSRQSLKKASGVIEDIDRTN